MAKGVIHHSGRGWYSAIPEPAVLDQSVTDPVRQDLIKRFPFLPHYVWSTLQINPWMHQALGKFVTFVYADGDGANDVSAFLRQEMSRKLLTGRRVEMGALLARLRDHKLKLEDLIGPPIKPIITET